MTEQDSLSISDASQWVSQTFDINVDSSNISYLIQYGHLRRFGSGSSTRVSKQELHAYYAARQKQAQNWKAQLGEDLNWDLSFDQYRESERTKHVHRLHPYKGKFIPQLVEYFLDQHTDRYKQETYFQPGDFVLDPFCGSGTTLVQSNELGINAVGIDVSEFNALISNIKVSPLNLITLQRELTRITTSLRVFVHSNSWLQFEQEVDEALVDYNLRFFPSLEFKQGVRSGKYGDEYGRKKAEAFQGTYDRLVANYNVDLSIHDESFLSQWYLPSTLAEIRYVAELIEGISEVPIRNAVRVVLSRTMRSSRATTHADLATLKGPVTRPYYCRKHFKMCAPLYSILEWWESYSKDVVKRLYEFSKLRTDTFQYCLVGDSRDIEIFTAVREIDHSIGNKLINQRFRGIFSSPPYVGLIDYHDQHAYAYELFGIPKRDNDEIGRMALGQGANAKQSYIEGISRVLINSRQFLCDGFDVFLVANDKWRLYPEIARRSGMRIVKEYLRPVLNRTEKDKGAYAETIFHLRDA